MNVTGLNLFSLRFWTHLIIFLHLTSSTYVFAYFSSRIHVQSHYWNILDYTFPVDNSLSPWFLCDQLYFWKHFQHIGEGTFCSQYRVRLYVYWLDFLGHELKSQLWFWQGLEIYKIGCHHPNYPRFGWFKAPNAGTWWGICLQLCKVWRIRCWLR